MTQREAVTQKPGVAKLQIPSSNHRTLTAGRDAASRLSRESNGRGKSRTLRPKTWSEIASARFCDSLFYHWVQGSPLPKDV